MDEVGEGEGDEREPAPRKSLAARAVLALAREFAAEHESWALWLPALLGLGIGLYFNLAFEPPLLTGLAAAGAIAMLAFLLRQRRAALVPALAACAVAIGFSTAQWRSASVAAPLIRERIGPANIEGVVETVERRDTGGFRMVVTDLAIDRLEPRATPYAVRITVRAKGDAPWPGDRVKLRAILLPNPPPSAPGLYDFARQAWFQRLGGTGIAIGPIEAAPVAGRETWTARLSAAIERARFAITERILAAAPGASGAIAAALMTGERGAIPEPVNGAFRDSGLAHLLSISGLHIGMIAGIAFFVCRALLALIEPVALKFPIKKWAAGAAILTAFLYLAISGATIPTQRSFLMTGLVFLAIILDRTAISLRIIAWAAAAILILTPESLLNVSFQMSFAAVIALVAAYEAAKEPLAAMRRELTGFRRPLLYLLGGIFTTVVAQAAIDPIAIYHFNRFVAYGLIANAIAVPLTGAWIMPLALISFAAMPFGLEETPLRLMCGGIDVVIAVAEWVAALPGAVILIPAWPLPSLIVFVLGGLWLCLWRRPWRLAGLVGIAAALAIGALNPAPGILVNGDGSLMAIREADGRLSFSNGRGGTYARETWLRRNAEDPALKPVRTWPVAAARNPETNTPLSCDSVGCVYRALGFTAAFAFDPRAYEEDCRRATLIVSRAPLRGPCPSAALVIDRFDLWRKGGHAIWLGRTPRVESVADSRGVRPWAIAP